MQQTKAVKMTAFDYLKWLVSIVLIAACVVGNVYLDAYSAAIRAAAIIVVVLIALGIAKTTSHGGVAWGFIRESRLELRKVVWPTRQETVQMTLIVALVVALMAIVLWVVDAIFATGVSHIVT